MDVYALVLESGGADLAVAACAASVALADAGVQMADLVSACAVVRAPHAVGLMCAQEQSLCTFAALPGCIPRRTCTWLTFLACPNNTVTMVMYTNLTQYGYH